MKTELYDDSFYNAISSGSLKSAEIILPLVLEVLPKINSAVDFGCGTGIWLSVLNKLGINEIKGYDGSWVNKNMLMIPKEFFMEAELEKGIIVDKRYDLAISLEVAEHLPKESAELFVESLVKASDIVLFSAAIPFQGGVEHINEQPPEYWNNFFVEKGYVAMDFLRNKIWNEEYVKFWYKQNILLYVKEYVVDKIKVKNAISFRPLYLVHPECYLANIETIKNVKEINEKYKSTIDLFMALQLYKGKYILFGQKNAENYIELIKNMGFDLPLEIWDNKIYGSEICGVLVVKPHKMLVDKIAIICTVRTMSTYNLIVEELPNALKSQVYFFEQI